MADHLVQICEFKALWDIWRTTERHFVSSADFMLLEKRAHGLLATGLTLEKAVAEAKDIAKQFHNVTRDALDARARDGSHILHSLHSLKRQTMLNDCV